MTNEQITKAKNKIIEILNNESYLDKWDLKEVENGSDSDGHSIFMYAARCIPNKNVIIQRKQDTINEEYNVIEYKPL